MMAVLTPIGWAFTGDFQAALKGGAQAFVSWICGKIKSAGSSIFLVCRVKKVLLDNRNEAMGVPMVVKAAANASLLILKDMNSAEAEHLKRPMDEKQPKSVMIGIPRTLYYFSHPGLWETFFRDLGMKPVVAEPSTQQTVERAGLISEAEHCLPMKMFDAHLAELTDKVDMVFVPRILSSLKGHIACPKLGAIPDAAKAQLGQRAEVLTIDIDEEKLPLSVSLAALGKKLGASKRMIKAAIHHATEVMKNNLARLSERSKPEPGRILILGHPYNLHDDFFSGPIIRKLESLNVGVDLVGFDREEVPSVPIKWDMCSMMYDALQQLDPQVCRGVIQISSFNCGCDSIVVEFYREVLRQKGIPFMILVVDEHAAQAGIETRLEAFVDSSRWLA